MSARCSPNALVRPFLPDTAKPFEEGFVAGIDPRLNGAVAVLDRSANLISVRDMPTLGDGAQGFRGTPMTAPLKASCHNANLAQRLGEAGLAVFPVGADKRPISPGSWKDAATADREAIDRL